MIWAIDSAGSPVYVGQEWDAYGAAAHRPSTRDGVLDHVHPDDRAPALAIFSSAQDKRLPLTCVFRLRHADGTFRRMVARGVPSFDPSDGRLVGFLGTTHELGDGDMTVSAVGLGVIAEAARQGPRTTIDRIADHLLVARALAIGSGEARLSAICDFALKQIFGPYGQDPTARQ